MFEADEFKILADRVLARSRADQTEVVVIATDSSLTRFARSSIHQNVSERDAEVRVRAVIGRRVGVATTNNLADDAIERVIERAVASAERQPENPAFPGLPEDRPAGSVEGYRQETAQCPPERRARMAKTICDLAVDSGSVASGALTTEATFVGVANSRGIFVHDRTSRANLLTVVMDGDASGYAERTNTSVDAIDAEQVGREAIDKAVRSRGATLLEPGEYPVVLEEYAVGDLLTYLAYMGFGALAYQEGTSFLRDKLGQRIVDERISISDDGGDARGLPMAFDYEGVPKRRVDLIADGVAAGVVYDSATAAREGRASTGHALPAPNTFGPFPAHLVMAAGGTPKSELAHGIDRGIWVTRFHYVNVLKSDTATLTGLTRDGTFLIEHGELTRPIKNFRFTQGVLDAWDGLDALGRDLELIDSWGGGVLVPAMRLERFAFTGVSDAGAM